MARYTLAVSRGTKQNNGDADFIPCLTFGKMAEAAQKFLYQGMRVTVSGRIQTGGFQKKDGKELKVNEKLLALHFLMRLQGGRRTIKVVAKTFLQDWSERFGVVKYTVQKYLFNLKSFFNITKKDKFYIITSKEDTFLKEKKKNSENQLIGEQVVKAECRRRAIKIETKKHLQDVAYVVQIQYKGILDSMKRDQVLPNPVGDLLDLYKKETGETKLIPSLLHKLFLTLKTKYVENLHSELMERVKNPVDIFRVDDYEFNFA